MTQAASRRAALTALADDIPLTRVRADLVVVKSTIFDDDPGRLQGIEDHTIEKLIPKLGVDAFAIVILPGLPGSM